MHAGGHRLAHLVRQDERRLALSAEIARERQHALALYFVTEDRDGGKVGAQRHLMGGEQRAAGDGELRLAFLLCATPARRAVGALAVVDLDAATTRASRLAIGLRPAYFAEHRLGLAICHPHDVRETEGACCRRQQKVLSHGANPCAGRIGGGGIPLESLYCCGGSSPRGQSWVLGLGAGAAGNSAGPA